MPSPAQDNRLARGWRGIPNLVAPEKQPLILSLLLVVVVLLLYNHATHFSFLNLDDDVYVTENTHVTSGLNWSTVTWAMTSIEGNWHPLTWLSHAADYRLFRLNPAGHHFTNIVLHAVNAVLLFLLLLRGTRRIGPSFLIAALFAVHPLNVESVAWISERKNVLSTMFFFLTVGAYGWYSSRPVWWRYGIVVVCFACGLASKPMLVTLPFVLLLFDYWPLGRIRGIRAASALNLPSASLRKLFLEKLPLLALAIAASALTIIAQRESGAVASLQRFSLATRFRNSIYSYAVYAWKTFWPAHLAPLYPHPGNSLAGWKLALAALFLIAVTGLALKLRSRPYLLVGWLFFLGTLVPVIGLVQVGSQAMADRYAYIPCLGIFVMVVVGASDIADWKRTSFGARVVVSACTLILLAAVTYRQIDYWKNSLTLWSHTLAVTENNFGAEDGMGSALVQLGQVDEAYLHFQRAAAIAPYDAFSRAYIGVYLDLHGQLSEAIQEYETALHLGTTVRFEAFIHAKLGYAYLRLGNRVKAKDNFEAALQLDSRAPIAWMGMGDLALEQGDSDEAVRDFSRGVALQPVAEGYVQLGRALEKANRRTEALAAYRQALKLSPKFAEAQQAEVALFEDNN